MYLRTTLLFTYVSRTFNYTPFTNVQKFFLFSYIIYLATLYLHTCICRYLLITYLRWYLPDWISTWECTYNIPHHLLRIFVRNNLLHVHISNNYQTSTYGLTFTHKQGITYEYLYSNCLHPLPADRTLLITCMYLHRKWLYTELRR